MSNLQLRRMSAGIIFLGAWVLFAQNDSSVQLRSQNLARFNNDIKIIVDEALRNNPALHAARFRIDAADKSVRINKALDPPQFDYESMYPIGGYIPMEYSLSLQQMVPFPGKRASAASVEKQRASMYGSDEKVLERDIVKRIKDVFYEIYLIDRKYEINTENQNFTKRFIAIAGKQYEVGMGQQADILRGQTELSKLLNDAIVLRQARNSMVSMINALANRPFTMGIDVVPEIESPPLDLAFHVVEPLARLHRPELESMRFNVTMLKAEIAMNKKERYPDFMIKGEYRNQIETEMESWGGMVGLIIPLAPWSVGRYSAKIAQGEFLVKAAESEIENMRNMISTELQDALYKVTSTQEQMHLLKRTVIPQSRQTLESTVSAYQNGKLEFLMLIDAERMLLMAQEQYHMAVMNHLSATAALERAVGADLETILAESAKGNRQ